MNQAWISIPSRSTCPLLYRDNRIPGKINSMKNFIPIEVNEDLLHKLETAGRVPSKEKFRRMICNTLVYCGACPYGDRCVFLHDNRIRSDWSRVKSLKQSRVQSTAKDTFYWPDMNRRELFKMDSNGLPDANQDYDIPASFSETISNVHNRCVYSMWKHFIEFNICNNSVPSNEIHDCFANAQHGYNIHVSGLTRLQIFVELSNRQDQASVTPRSHSEKVSMVTNRHRLLGESKEDKTSNTTLETSRSGPSGWATPWLAKSTSSGSTSRSYRQVCLPNQKASPICKDYISMSCDTVEDDFSPGVGSMSSDFTSPIYDPSPLTLDSMTQYSQLPSLDSAETLPPHGHRSNSVDSTSFLDSSPPSNYGSSDGSSRRVWSPFDYEGFSCQPLANQINWQVQARGGRDSMDSDLVYESMIDRLVTTFDDVSDDVNLRCDCLSWTNQDDSIKGETDCTTHPNGFYYRYDINDPWQRPTPSPLSSSLDWTDAFRMVDRTSYDEEYQSNHHQFY